MGRPTQIRNESIPAADSARMAALSEIGLDAEDAENLFDPCARLALRATGANRAFVTFPAPDGVVFRGRAGDTGGARDITGFCPIALERREGLVVADLAADLRFRGSELLGQNPPHAAYAAAPVILPDGLHIGVVCVVFDQAHEFDADELDTLRDLAWVVAQHCERRRDSKRLQAALEAKAAADAQMASFVDNAPVAIAIIDHDLRYVRVSPRWRQETGVGDLPVIGRRVDEIFPQALAVFNDMYQRCLTGESFQDDAVEVIDYSGRSTWVRAEMAPWRPRGDAIEGVIVLRHDITDTMKLLKATERSEQRLKLAVEIANILIFDYDLIHQEFDFLGNRDFLGDPPAGGLHHPRDLLVGIHPDDIPQILEEQQAALARGDARVEHVYRLARYGSDRWFASVSELFPNADGQPARLLCVIREVSRERAAARALTDARNQAEAASRAKSEFLANMSHEIRTPLNGVLGVAGALATTELDHRQREMVTLIESSASALERLLSDILDLSRVEAGRTDLVSEPFELMELMVSTAALFEPKAREKGVRFMFEPSLDACDCYLGDATRIRQILSNFLSNAVKFTAAGEVRLTVVSLGEGEGGRRRLRFAVSDTGIGFRPQDKDRLFQRFEQADGSVTRQFGGSGLGLAISRALAERMGGSVDAQSVEGQGAVFSLSLELAPAVRVARTPKPDPKTERTLRPLDILVAEDHAANRRVVELILEAVDARLTVVENGAQAVAAATSRRFDLILMDIQMPVMDGLTAIRAIRAHEAAHALPRTPILTLTANAMREHVESSTAAGADGHISKPIRAPALLDAVMGACAPQVD